MTASRSPNQHPKVGAAHPVSMKESGASVLSDLDSEGVLA